MLLKGMGDSLSKYEPLTPDIDGVMALWIFRKRAQTAENWQKLDFSILDFSRPRPLEESLFGLFYWEVRKQSVIKKIPVQNGPRQRGENKSSHLVQVISPYKSTLLHFGPRVHLIFVLEGQSSTERHSERSFLWRWQFLGHL